jgi:hypothetical protein
VSMKPVQVRTRAFIDGHGYSTTLIYDPLDPFAVTVSFPGAEPNDWSLARDLLIDGQRYPVGLGDVTVAPAGDRLVLCLSPDGDPSVVYLDVAVVKRFLDLSLDLVPRGAEVMNFDRELDEILTGGIW